MSILGFALTIIGSFACTALVLSCIWASEDRKRDHEDDWSDDDDNESGTTP